MGLELLEKHLSFQLKILHSKNIPKKYKPSSYLITSQPQNAILQSHFEKAFEKVFFDHLKKVITANQIAIEIAKAKSEAETHPSSSYQPNNLQQPTNLLTTPTTPVSSPSIPPTTHRKTNLLEPHICQPINTPVTKKRKNTAPHQKATKKPFLEYYQLSPNDIT
jgi:hypothetical protein